MLSSWQWQGKASQEHRVWCWSPVWMCGQRPAGPAGRLSSHGGPHSLPGIYVCGLVLWQPLCSCPGCHASCPLCRERPGVLSLSHLPCPSSGCCRVWGESTLSPCTHFCVSSPELLVGFYRRVPQWRLVLESLHPHLEPFLLRFAAMGGPDFTQDGGCISVFISLHC